ncbi:hypothetical protein LCGC14_1285500 [marine sediment metagenome]|uniref:Uncharacterized protein n=1 Tax=marine sediment metagenome TaxID=412755 RepID=A0A0F9KU14_9ZZZZ
MPNPKPDAGRYKNTYMTDETIELLEILKARTTLSRSRLLALGTELLAKRLAEYELPSIVEFLERLAAKQGRKTVKTREQEAPKIYAERMVRRRLQIKDPVVLAAYEAEAVEDPQAEQPHQRRHHTNRTGLRADD